MRYILLIMIFIITKDAFGIDTINAYRHNDSVVALHVSGARPDSCAPETRDRWLARDQGGILQVFYWDTLLGNGCFSAPTTYSINLSINDICMESQCKGKEIELYSVSGCNPDSPQVNTCIMARAVRVNYNEVGKSTPRVNRTTSGPWFGSQQRLILVTGQGDRGVLYSDGALGSTSFEGTFDGNIFFGTSGERTAFAYMDDANTLISDAIGRATQNRRLDDQGRFIVTLGDFEGSPLVVSSVSAGGTYFISNPHSSARTLRIVGTSQSTANILVDDRYGGGVTCSNGFCLFEYATASGTTRFNVKASDFGYEAILENGSPGGISAFRVAP